MPQEINEANFPSTVDIKILSTSLIKISRYEIMMRKELIRLPPNPGAKFASFSLSWHKLLFDHIKIYACKQGVLSHYRYGTATVKLSELQTNAGPCVVECTVLNAADKSEKLGTIKLLFEFFFESIRERRLPNKNSNGSFSILSDKTIGGFNDFLDLFSAFKGVGWNNMSKTDFIRGLLELQEYYKAFPITRTKDVVTDIEQLKNAIYFMDFSLPSYGVVALNFFGYGKGLSDFMRLDSDRKATMEHLKLEEKDVLAWEYGSPELYKPNFFCCYDKKTNSIVVSIRGTFNLHESLLDANLEYRPVLDGYAHNGMANSAEYFKMKHFDNIVTWIKDRGAKALYLVGHSLGAAVCSILMLLIREDLLGEFGSDFICKAYNFATPPCISKQLCIGTENYIEHYINENDIVPHMSYGGLMDLKELTVKAVDLLKDKSVTKEQRHALLKELQLKLRSENKHPKLYAPGKHYFMYKTSRVRHHLTKKAMKKGLIETTGNPLIDGAPHYVVEATDIEYFSNVDIRPNLLLHHILNKYDSSLRKAHLWLATFLAKNPNFSKNEQAGTANSNSNSEEDKCDVDRGQPSTKSTEVPTDLPSRPRIVYSVRNSSLNYLRKASQQSETISAQTVETIVNDGPSSGDTNATKTNDNNMNSEEIGNASISSIPKVSKQSVNDQSEPAAENTDENPTNIAITEK